MAPLPLLTLAEVNDLCLDQSALAAISPVFYCRCSRTAETSLRKLQRSIMVTSRGLFYVIRSKETQRVNTDAKRASSGSLRLNVSNAVMLCNDNVTFQFAIQDSVECREGEKERAVVRCNAQVSRIGNPSFSLKMARSDALRLVEVLDSFKESNPNGLNVVRVESIPLPSRWKRIIGRSWKDQMQVAKATPLSELPTQESDPVVTAVPITFPMGSDGSDQSLDGILIEISVLEKVCDRLSELKLQVVAGGASPAHLKSIECERVKALILSRVVCSVCESVAKRNQLRESNEFEEMFLRMPINQFSL